MKNILQKYGNFIKATFLTQNPALQADEEGGISSASCASLACGYEDNALRAAGENTIAIRYNNDTVISCEETPLLIES
jgi:hypothetical protein